MEVTKCKVQLQLFQNDSYLKKLYPKTKKES